MQKKILSLCIALAMGNTSYASIDITETQKAEENVCPAKLSELTKEQKNKLPANCNTESDDDLWGWLAGGATVLTAAIVGVVNNNSGGGYTHGSTADPIPDPTSDPTSDPTPDPTSDPTPDPTPDPISDPVFIDTITPDSGQTLTGDNQDVTVNDISAKDGTGLSINGNNANVKTDGAISADGAASIAIDIAGENALVENNSNSKVSDGGTGTKITGDSAEVKNSGDNTISGDGSTGTLINGNDAVVSNTGNSDISSGAIGTMVNGDNSTVNLGGDEGKTVVYNISGGAKGAMVTGSNGTLSISNMTANVTDAQSSLVDISGNNTKSTLNGEINVKNGAHGINVSGDNATVDTQATVNVHDKDSVGINVTATNVAAGDKTSFNNSGDINVSNNATGVLISGNKSDVALKGNVNITSVTDGNGILQTGKGVVVNGNNSTVSLEGNMNLTNQAIHAGQLMFVDQSPMIGIDASGTGNTINLSGVLNIARVGAQDNSNPTAGGSDEIAFTGVNVNGGGNTVNVNGGLNVKLDSQGLNTAWNAGGVIGVKVDGASIVNVSGNSSLYGNQNYTRSSKFAEVNNGGILNLQDNSSLTLEFVSNETSQFTGQSGSEGYLQALGAGSSVNNAGLIDGSALDMGMILSANTGSAVTNTGTIRDLDIKNKGKIALMGAVNEGSTATNKGDLQLRSTSLPVPLGHMYDYPLSNTGNSGYGINGGKNADISNAGTIELQGAALFGMGTTSGASAINSGTISLNGFTPVVDEADNVVGETAYVTDNGGAWQRGAGMIAGSKESYGAGAIALNTGTIDVKNSGFGMLAIKGGTVTNQGNIVLSANSTTVHDSSISQLVGMGVINKGVAINDINGVININTSVGQAFYNDGTGQIINRGMVVVGEGVNSSVDNSAATVDTKVSQYIIGTNADGSAGTMLLRHATLKDVKVDTGFTAGSAAKNETFDNVFQGTDIQGAENIASDSVVWNAQGNTDASGNVDVTMTKNAYTDVTDDSVSGVANALEEGYTNNRLYQSLNLKSSVELTNAMQQISGSKAVSAFNEAKVLSNRFTMLSDNAVVNANGLGFNVMAKGDSRAELGNDASYDMLALSQKLSLTDSHSLTLQYGIARLDGNGDVKTAGDNGLTGGYSQFFGLNHDMYLGNNMSWGNSLRYDNHQLDSKRSIQYSGVNEVADANNSQQYMEMKSQFSKGYDLSDTLKFIPSIGTKLRYTRDGSVNESGAGDYNLKMNAGTETAIDAIAGMELTYANKNGWAATGSVEGGPNLSYSKSTRTAQLQGAAGQKFAVDDEQHGGGMNSLTQAGVKYNSGNATLGMDAYNWQEDGTTDRGLRMNYKLRF